MLPRASARALGILIGKLMREPSSKSRAVEQSSPAAHSAKMPQQLLPTGPLRLAKLLDLGKGKGMGLSQQQQLGGRGSHKKGHRRSE